MVWSFIFSSGGSFAFPPAEDRQDEQERADEDEVVVACCPQYYEGNRTRDLEEEDDHHGQLVAIPAAATITDAPLRIHPTVLAGLPGRVRANPVVDTMQPREMLFPIGGSLMLFRLTLETAFPVVLLKMVNCGPLASFALHCRAVSPYQVMCMLVLMHCV